MRRGELPLPVVVRGPRGFQLFSCDSPTIKVQYWLKLEATVASKLVRGARLTLTDVQIYRTVPWRAPREDDDDGPAWGEVISYELRPGADVAVGVPIGPSAPSPAERLLRLLG
jgi:hypothetical protein